MWGTTKEHTSQIKSRKGAEHVRVHLCVHEVGWKEGEGGGEFSGGYALEVAGIVQLDRWRLGLGKRTGEACSRRQKKGFMVLTRVLRRRKTARISGWCSLTT